MTILALSNEELVNFLIKAKKLSNEETMQFNKRLDDIRQRGYFIGDDPGYPCSRAIYPVYQTGKIKGSLGVCMLGQNLDSVHLENYSSVVEYYAKMACEHMSLRI